MTPIGKFDSLDFRYKIYLDYAKMEYEHPDEGLPKMVLATYANRKSLPDTERLLLAYLYGMCYNPLTTIYLFEDFPISKPESRDIWWINHKGMLDFQQDKVKIKYMNQLVPSIETFIEHYSELYTAVFTKEFKDVKQVITKIKYFGSHATYLMYDVLEAMYGESLSSLPKKIDWNEHRLPAEGMLHLIGRDELVPLTGRHLSKDILTILDNALESLLASTNIKLLETESVLCAYRKLFKQTRYVGFYRDRHLENIYSAQVPKHIIDFNLEVRATLLPKEYLGEYSGWQGIRKDKCKDFVKYGKL